MWSYFFGGSAASKSKSKELPKKAIVELREHINLLNKKQSHLQSQINNQVIEAKKFLNSGNKVQAKNALKKKKIYESQLEKLENTIGSLEQQLFSIENANLNLETMKAMKQGSMAMKAIHNGLDIDKVEDTMDEVREQVELGDEISEAIARPLYVSSTDLIDDEELDEELDMLAEESQEQINETLIDVKKPAVAVPASQAKIDLPNVPNAEIKNPVTSSNDMINDEEEDEDERALRELQAEMGL
ncbi:hypothetical protein Kpol_297p3 [Vanderwaltozyma polyspora DSM 70294]|uniref:Vacuolar-sorting protein SNF7 n=1 Tax=Vanderwaltozyma polyspora (strain ATCC 22028 / DSM 70294 / BCRC 21397 / CBS 2163 / NBRC 10782 / NRRL Y-8283 / UCD 57-17) TaxID=436907 RepID=A7TSK7_VANPO|nr:uncharacterized protein Kpol_297p3 [Vanderwaltozyma polyspora DSM 70294]EDO14742.1 hypothetical protein Kpol_297p3 [Vanderwaltozyma polyspora DSM 70294]